MLEFIDDEKESNNGCSITCSGIELAAPAKDNLCVKAYNLLNEDFDLPSITIHLHKIIPAGAGLGGGSSDAASMLKNLNKEYGLNITSKKLHEYAEKLGSDVPFFINNKPVVAYNTGNKIREISISLDGKCIVIVYPEIQISTKQAYSNAFVKEPRASLEDMIKLPVQEWKHAIKNDFERTIFPKYPKLRSIKEELYNMGALYASLSGSGSSLYGIFSSVPQIPEKIKTCFNWQYKV